jgi:Ca2+-transporting ATPase
MAVGNVKILWITTRVLFNVDTSNSTERFGLAVALTPTDPKGKEIQVTRWWQIGINELGNNLKTDVLRGLSEQEAKRRITEHGPNQLREKKGKHPFFLFLDQFKDFIIWVLIGAALVSGFLREWVDTVAILVIVILNAVMGFVQTYRAEKSLAALKRMSSPSTKVIRDDKRFMIPSTDLVPGDLIEIEAGDHVPADCRITWHSANFAVQEASLTGESEAVEKKAEAIQKEEVPLGDRINMAFMGTSVVTGKSRAVIVSTGMSTELGRIADMIQSITQETTPLQKKLDQFGKFLVFLCFGLVSLVFLMEWLRGGRLIDVFLTSVSLAVAAIPEGLPAVVTIALALGVQRMVKRNALIRKLPSVETLGCATVICSDKTGTLTKNEMTVQFVYADGKTYRVTGIGYEPEGVIQLDAETVRDLGNHSALQQTLLCGVLCNGARLVRTEGKMTVAGDPTEGALLTAAAKAGMHKEETEADFPFADEIPFDSDRKRMTLLRHEGTGITAFVKGAPDFIFPVCTRILSRGSVRPLTDADREAVRIANEGFGHAAMRVLAFARREVSDASGSRTAESVERDLTFLGLVAMIDPPRDEARQAIAACRTAGIRTVMITGDHRSTAVAIASKLGFFGEDSTALTGEELDRLDETTFRDQVRSVSVYARVSPEHKLRIVRAWRSHGEVTAMTGDGVNDAPAVKEADIGVAMGITGTDVTKEVSDMIVTDDNFASIVSAVEEGRGIYDNIKKFIHYLLSCNAGEILVMFLASLAGFPVPLLPIHILWMNLVTDGLPALALGVDPPDTNLMLQPPRPSDEAVMTRPQAARILLQGAMLAACSLAAFAFVLYVENEGIQRARTAAFIVLAVSQLFHSFNCRNQRESLFTIGVFSNAKLILAVLVSFGLQIAAVTVPFLQTVFKTASLTLIDWGVIVLLSSFPLWFMEAVKWAGRRRERRKKAKTA